jgi:4-hydroxy-3-methylbut-2-en-1-yl diphosphate synthase IspG/GcpE
MVIPLSIAISERGFSKQNLIKSHLHTSLTLETLGALMRISCANFPIENINWNAVMLVWKNMKDRKIHPLL